MTRKHVAGQHVDRNYAQRKHRTRKPPGVEARDYTTRELEMHAQVARDHEARTLLLHVYKRHEAPDGVHVPRQPTNWKKLAS